MPSGLSLKLDRRLTIKKAPSAGTHLGLSRCLMLRLVCMVGRVSGDGDRSPKRPNALGNCGNFAKVPLIARGELRRHQPIRIQSAVQSNAGWASYRTVTAEGKGEGVGSLQPSANAEMNHPGLGCDM